MKYKRSGKEAELTQVTAHSGGSKCHETTWTTSEKSKV
jgi:hypothetical protein